MNPRKAALIMTAEKRPVVSVVDDVESIRKSIAAVLETTNMAVCDYASGSCIPGRFQARRGGLPDRGP
jgi:FixJ family two-component response regulator